MAEQLDIQEPEIKDGREIQDDLFLSDQYFVSIGDMTSSQQRQRQAILNTSRILFMEPSLGLNPWLDTLPQTFAPLPTRSAVHEDRGCHGPNEVTLVVEPPKGGTYKKYFPPYVDGPVTLPLQQYATLNQGLRSDNVSISLALSHRPIRFGGVVKKNGREIVILDNTTNYYESSVKKLVDTVDPSRPPIRQEGESEDEFLLGKDFRVVEGFTFSEDPEDTMIVHSTARHENMGLLDTNITLRRLTEQIGYIASFHEDIIKEFHSKSSDQFSSYLARYLTRASA